MPPNNISNALLFHGKFHANKSSITMSNDSAIRTEMTEYIQTVNLWLTIVEIVMVTCGILGNGLALIVINRRSLRGTSSSVFITYLAIFDISVLVVHITSLASSYWIQWYILHCFLTYLTDLVTFCSVWIMVIMTLDRCIAVRSPFLAKRFCTTEHARYSIYILILFALLLFSSTFPVIYTVDEIQQKCGVRPQYQTIIRFIKPTIFYFAPDILLLANLFVIYELFMATRQRKKTLMNPENAISQLNAVSFNRKQQQLTVMLVTVSLSFYFFTTPAIIDYIRQLHPPQHYDIKRLKTRFLLMNLSVFWLQMSSATNFLFYCLAGSKFRAASLETISEVYDFIQDKLHGHADDDSESRREQRRRRKRKSQTDIRMQSQAINNGLAADRTRRLSAAVPQVFPCPLNNSSKRPSNETLISSHLNSRRASRTALNVNEI